MPGQSTTVEAPPAIALQHDVAIEGDRPVMRLGSWFVFVAAAISLVLLATGHASAQKRQPPYYASIVPGEALMRSGPGRNYPGTWLYKRPDLPIKVVELYEDWRK